MEDPQRMSTSHFVRFRELWALSISTDCHSADFHALLSPSLRCDGRQREMWRFEKPSLIDKCSNSAICKQSGQLVSLYQLVR